MNAREMALDVVLAATKSESAFLHLSDALENAFQTMVAMHEKIEELEERIKELEEGGE